MIVPIKNEIIADRFPFLTDFSEAIFLFLNANSDINILINNYDTTLFKRK